MTTRRQSKQKSDKRREQKRIERGISDRCLCAHKFLEHYAKGKCKVKDCNCIKFENINTTLFYTTIYRLQSLGFYHPLNDTLLCRYCGSRIQVGHWHDLMVFYRIKEHLRLQHLRRRLPARARKTA